MGTEKEGGAAKEVEAPGENAAPPEVKEVPVSEIKDGLKEEIAGIKEAIAAQKAKGEITGASESTLQVLYEELKAARADLAALREIGAKTIPVSQTDKWAKWLPW